MSEKNGYKKGIIDIPAKVSHRSGKVSQFDFCY